MTVSDPPASDAPLTRRALRNSDSGELAQAAGDGIRTAVEDSPADAEASAPAQGVEGVPAMQPPPTEGARAIEDTRGIADAAGIVDRPRVDVPPPLPEPPHAVALAWLADSDVQRTSQAARPGAIGRVGRVPGAVATAGVAPGAVGTAGVAPGAVGTAGVTTADVATAPTSALAADEGDPPLVEDWPRRSPLRPSVLFPTAIVLGLIAVYSVAMLLWPLHAVLPQVENVAVQSAVAPAAAPAWPAQGSAAVGVTGMGGPLASAVDPRSMASITKIVTALVVLDAMPLAIGETGPQFAFTSRDRQIYRDTLADGESALNVPVGGTLSEYQLLQGMLIGSAGNYADRLAGELYPSDRLYAAAATEWLTAHGIAGITIVDPSGIGRGNTATPAALIALAERAMINPVIAGIVATASVELPGAGLVENTNALLGDPGVVGVKTGTLGSDYNLLVGADITVGETVVRVYATTLGQPDSETRFAATRALLAELGTALQPTIAVPEGTVTGRVTTLWGSRVDIVTESDARIILWNSASGSVTPGLELRDMRASGDEVGSVTVRGPLDTAVVPARLAADVEGPSAWWRLTHPLELLGLLNPAS